MRENSFYMLRSFLCGDSLVFGSERFVPGRLVHSRGVQSALHVDLLGVLRL